MLSHRLRLCMRSTPVYAQTCSRRCLFQYYYSKEIHFSFSSFRTDRLTEQCQTGIANCRSRREWRWPNGPVASAKARYGSTSRQTLNWIRFEFEISFWKLERHVQRPPSMEHANYAAICIEKFTLKLKIWRKRIENQSTNRFSGDFG